MNKTFIINEFIKIECEYRKTRNGFNHHAVLFIDGVRTEYATCQYINRTWESYNYQTVLQKLCDKAKLSEGHKKLFQEKIKNGFREEAEEETKSMFHTIANVMAMGEVLSGDSQKSKNDWKLRMARAGLENKGLHIPDDWESLDEATKEERLNAIMQELRK